MTRPAGRSGAASVRGPLAKASRPESEPGCCPYSNFTRANSYAVHVSADAKIMKARARASRFAARCVNMRGIRKFFRVWPGLGFWQRVWGLANGTRVPSPAPIRVPGLKGVEHHGRLKPACWAVGTMGQGYSRDPAHGDTGERLLQRLCIVIPTLNEADNISACIHR